MHKYFFHLETYKKTKIMLRKYLKAIIKNKFLLNVRFACEITYSFIFMMAQFHL